MTTADVPGPDGLVYPDFRYAGTRPGKNILDAPAPHSVNLRDFGGVPGGNIDAALRKALTALPKGGGVIRFEAGEYTMKRFLTLSRDRVALVGAGSGATRIICAYDTPPDGIDFYALPDGGRMSPKQPILIVARPRQEGEPVQSIRLELDGRRIAGFTRSLHSGNHSQLTAKLPADCAPGEHRLRAVVTWFGRPPISREIKITVDPERAVTLPQKGYSAIITLRGKGVEGSPILLAKDAKRGDKVLELASEAVDLKTGDLILLQAEESDRFRAEIGNSCRWGVSRRVLLTVAGREGKRLLLDQPVRVDYPVADAAAIRRCSAVRGVGIQGITFEMKHDFWYHTILLESALDCIIRDVKVLKTGRNPVWTVLAKFCTVSDCSFTDSWYKGGGNSAYVGFGQSYDCLMERVETSKMRHAPVLQWSASGNVIRESTFLHSDAQWHAGWPHENLFENCRILSDTKEFGGYGHAFFASGPADSSHGPSGPRNVVYHCDAESMESSVKLNGNNENWFFVYNRLIARNGDGFHLRDAAPDTLLVNNQVILKTPGRALLLQAGVDSPGLTLTGNRFSGEKAMTVRGLTAPEIDRDNRQDSTALPEPPVPSLYLYQKITPR